MELYKDYDAVHTSTGLQLTNLNGNNYTQEEMKTAYDIVLEERKKNEYKELRRTEYPSMLDYIDGIVKGDNTQIQKYIDECNAVKAKYPKPI